MARAYVGLGANLGDARATLATAFDALAALPRTTLAARSSIWRSAPIDSSGPDYLNAAAALDTALEPRALLDALLAIEAVQGRQRPYYNAPRTLDLDLLLYGEQVLDSPRLTLPHPRLHRRAFVLAPLLELWPDGVVPGHGRLDALLAAIADQRVERAER